MSIAQNQYVLGQFRCLFWIPWVKKHILVINLKHQPRHIQGLFLKIYHKFWDDLNYRLILIPTAGENFKKIGKVRVTYYKNFMTAFYNVALKIEYSFKLQGCLSPLWKVKISLIKVKTKWDKLKMQQDNHHLWLNITIDKMDILRPEKNGFVPQKPLFHIFCKIAFYIFFVIKYKTLGVKR